MLCTRSYIIIIIIVATLMMHHVQIKVEPPPTPSPVPAPATSGPNTHRMVAGDILYPGDYLESENGLWRLKYQTDVT